MNLVVTVAITIDVIYESADNVCGEIPGFLGEEQLLICDPPLAGQFVQVQMRETDRKFHLAEIQVYAL